MHTHSNTNKRTLLSLTLPACATSGTHSVSYESSSTQLRWQQQQQQHCGGIMIHVYRRWDKIPAQH